MGCGIIYIKERLFRLNKAHKHKYTWVLLFIFIFSPSISSLAKTQKQACKLTDVKIGVTKDLLEERILEALKRGFPTINNLDDSSHNYNLRIKSDPKKCSPQAQKELAKKQGQLQQQKNQLWQDFRNTERQFENETLRPSAQKFRDTVFNHQSRLRSVLSKYDDYLPQDRPDFPSLHQLESYWSIVKSRIPREKRYRAKSDNWISDSELKVFRAKNKLNRLQYKQAKKKFNTQLATAKDSYEKSIKKIDRELQSLSIWRQCKVVVPSFMLDNPSKEAKEIGGTPMDLKTKISLAGLEADKIKVNCGQTSPSGSCKVTMNVSPQVEAKITARSLDKKTSFSTPLSLDSSSPHRVEFSIAPSARGQMALVKNSLKIAPPKSGVVLTARPSINSMTQQAAQSMFSRLGKYAPATKKLDEKDKIIYLKKMSATNQGRRLLKKWQQESIDDALPKNATSSFQSKNIKKDWLNLIGSMVETLGTQQSPRITAATQSYIKNNVVPEVSQILSQEINAGFEEAANMNWSIPMWGNDIQASPRSSDNSADKELAALEHGEVIPGVPVQLYMNNIKYDPKADKYDLSFKGCLNNQGYPSTKLSSPHNSCFQNSDVRIQINTSVLNNHLKQLYDDNYFCTKLEPPRCTEKSVRLTSPPFFETINNKLVLKAPKITAPPAFKTISSTLKINQLRHSQKSYFQTNALDLSSDITIPLDPRSGDGVFTTLLYILNPFVGLAKTAVDTGHSAAVHGKEKQTTEQINNFTSQEDLFLTEAWPDIRGDSLTLYMADKKNRHKPLTFKKNLNWKERRACEEVYAQEQKHEDPKITHQEDSIY